MITDRDTIKWCKSLHRTLKRCKDMDDLEILDEWCTRLMGAYRRSCRYDETDEEFLNKADKMMRKTARMLSKRKR